MSRTISSSPLFPRFVIHLKLKSAMGFLISCLAPLYIIFQNTYICISTSVYIIHYLQYTLRRQFIKLANSVISGSIPDSFAEVFESYVICVAVICGMRTSRADIIHKTENDRVDHSLWYPKYCFFFLFCPFKERVGLMAFAFVLFQNLLVNSLCCSLRPSDHLLLMYLC